MPNILLNMDNAILSRNLDLHDEHGNLASHVTILIGRPEQVNEREWSCAYSISGLGDINSKPFKINGIDSVQTIQCAFTVIKGTLAGSTFVKQGLLYWNGDNNTLIG